MAHPRSESGPLLPHLRSGPLGDDGAEDVFWEEDEEGSPPVRRGRGPWVARVVWKLGAAVILAGVAALGGATGGVAAYLVHAGPVPEMRAHEETLPPAWVGLEELPPHLPDAFLAIEDSKFREHLGVDPKGIVRAAAVNVWRGRYAQGASTITQQLARNLLPEVGFEKTLDRKGREALMALRLERHHRKEEILEVYLNRIYLGSGTHGVEEAARAYFGKSAREVTLAEAAALAAIPQLPEHFSPRNNPAASRERQGKVLDRMRDLGWITEREHQEALRSGDVGNPWDGIAAN